MARKKDSPQKAALRELMGNYLKENNVKVKDGTDVNSIMRDMMSIILEGALDQELDEELGYSKYDYRNKETDNSRNGHSQKTLHTSSASVLSGVAALGASAHKSHRFFPYARQIRRYGKGYCRFPCGTHQYNGRYILISRPTLL